MPVAQAKRAVKRALLAAGHYARRLRGDRFPGVAVLCYHGVRGDEPMPFSGLHVTARELESHCRLLRETCHPISLDEWRRGELPARPVLVTFDDGYRSVFTRARPILERWEIPAVLFVCSQPVAERRLLWYDAVARARGEAAVEPLKAAPWSEWRALAPVAAAAGDPAEVLTVEEVRQIAAGGRCEIGSHSAAHPILARAPRDQQRAQIADDQRQLEAWCGRPVTAFAYPNGRPGLDYTDETLALLGELGFDAAFTTRHGFATAREAPLERSRLLMMAGIDAAELAHRLAYSWRR
jgi:peptidoglycan/xylan/chitin deacetylase (PgdA/CDA1 family)